MLSPAFEEITGEQFQDKIVLAKEDALVKVTTSWSGACHIIAPLLVELASTYQSKIKFYVMDHDKDTALSNLYGVTIFPTILFFKSGTLVDRLSGVVSKAMINSRIRMIVKELP